MRLVFLIIIYFIFIPVGNTADFSKYKSTCADKRINSRWNKLNRIHSTLLSLTLNSDSSVLS